MFDTTTTEQYIETMVAQVAARCPISVDRLTLGAHPDGAKREEGELGLIDWARPGGHLVDTPMPECELVRRVGPVRALGAAMLAAVKYTPAGMDLINKVALEAEGITRSIPGGPEDPPERIAIAAQAVAAVMLGQAGEQTHCEDGDGRERSPHRAERPGDKLPIHRWDFDLLRAIVSAET